MIREANQIPIRFTVLGLSCTHFTRRASLIKLKAELKQCYKNFISLQPAAFIQTPLPHLIFQGETRVPSPVLLISQAHTCPFPAAWHLYLGHPRHRWCTDGSMVTDSTPDWEDCLPEGDMEMPHGASTSPVVTLVVAIRQPYMEPTQYISYLCCVTNTTNLAALSSTHLLSSVSVAQKSWRVQLGSHRPKSSIGHTVLYLKGLREA